MKNKYTVVDEVAHISVVRRDGSNHTILIDESDLEVVSKHNWSVDIRETWYIIAQAIYYDYTSAKYKKLYLHRLITQAPKDMFVDHINCNPLDNRRVNLRIVTPAQNSQNCIGARSHNNTSGVRGVSWNKRSGRWETYCCIEGKIHKLGMFSSLEEATKVSAEARALLLPFSKEGTELSNLGVV